MAADQTGSGGAVRGQAGTLGKGEQRGRSDVTESDKAGRSEVCSQTSTPLTRANLHPSPRCMSPNCTKSARPTRPVLRSNHGICP
jgi:hypothetical protein